jgi:hypothetical protein
VRQQKSLQQGQQAEGAKNNVETVNEGHKRKGPRRNGWLLSLVARPPPAPRSSAASIVGKNQPTVASCKGFSNYTSKYLRLGQADSNINE